MVTVNEIKLLRLNDVEDETLVCSQPLYSQVLETGRLRWVAQGQKMDFIFMITRELKMSVLHFSQKNQQLEVVSSYSIDR